jgi:hypothetical protein
MIIQQHTMDYATNGLVQEFSWENGKRMFFFTMRWKGATANELTDQSQVFGNQLG